MNKHFQKFKNQLDRGGYGNYCYVDMYRIESWEIDEDVIILHMNSGFHHRIYLTEEKMIKLFDELNKLDQ